jgi:copper chaperone
MQSFSVTDMTCGHCVSTITRAIQAIDPDAQVRADVATQRVHIEPSRASAAQLGEAIKDAGYTPVAVDGAGSGAAAVA